MRHPFFSSRLDLAGRLAPSMSFERLIMWTVAKSASQAAGVRSNFTLDRLAFGRRGRSACALETDRQEVAPTATIPTEFALRKEQLPLRIAMSSRTAAASW